MEHHIEMINNIPSYYRVEIFLKRCIFNIDKSKWPIHVVDYKKNK